MEEKEDEEDSAHHDGGSAWVAVVCSFLYHVITGAAMYSTGALYEPFMEAFPAESGKISLISSIMLGALFASAFFASLMISRVGEWKLMAIGGVIASLGFSFSTFATDFSHLYITYGILTGAGVGMGYMPAITLVLSNFTRKRSIAMAISVSGLGVGAMTIPHIIRYLDYKFGWRGAMLILAGVTLHTLVIGLICRSLQNVQNLKQYNINQKPGLTFNIFKSSKFILLVIHCALACFVSSILYVHLASFASSRGYDKSMGNILYTIMGLSDLLARPLYGGLIHLCRLTTFEFYIICLVVEIVAQALTPLASAYYTLCLLAVSFGCYLALLAVFHPLLAADILQKEEVATGYGFILLWEAAGFMAGAPVAGWVYDVTHYYPAIFYLMASVLFLSTPLLIWPCIAQRKNQQKELAQTISIEHISFLHIANCQDKKYSAVSSV